MQDKNLKLIISKLDFLKKPGDSRLLLVYDNNKLIDLVFANKNNSLLNSIHIAKVKNIVKNMDMAFLEIENNNTKELVYYNTKNQKHIFLNKKNNNILNEGDEILVQIYKEAAKTKQASAGANISISSIFSIISLGHFDVQFSSKIKSKSFKNNLSSIIKEKIDEILKNSNDEVFKSFIKQINIKIRTNTYDESLSLKDSILKEIELNINKLYNILNKSKYISCPKCIYRENSEIKNFLVAYYKELKEIVSDDDCILADLKKDENLKLIFDKFNIILKYYEDEKFGLDKLYSLNTLITDLLSKKLWLKSGAYLVIEPVEAFTIIDVNTGKNISNINNKEFIYKVNREAAIEISRQLRLRNLSGIILIDFISMTDNEYKKQILQILNEEFKKDRFKSKAIDFTALDLCEIVRQRKSKSIYEILKTK